MINLRQKF